MTAMILADGTIGQMMEQVTLESAAPSRLRETLGADGHALYGTGETRDHLALPLAQSTGGEESNPL